MKSNSTRSTPKSCRTNTADFVETWSLSQMQKFQRLLADSLDVAVAESLIYVDLDDVKTAEVAEVLNLATAGLKRGAVRPGLFEARVTRMVNIFVAGLSHA